MLFNSLHFLLFFPLVAVLHFLLPHRYRWFLLLIASYYFYMSWQPGFVFLIIVSTTVAYFTGLRMGKIAEKRRRRKYLLLSIAVNLGVLFFFKYFNFFNDTLGGLARLWSLPGPTLHLQVLLPVGISFYTFQTLSYTIDVYHGKIRPERHPGVFAVYISFFPQLVAGPIERARNLLPQFALRAVVDYGRITDGLKVMLWGFFLKIVIADRLGYIVDEVYNNIYEHQSLDYLIATYAFSFQIYCDFAGYSFIAIGAAKVLGFNLMDNFRRPYFSKSVGEFWKRWHISLSTWFRDYLYIPLGGNRVGRRRWLVNILIVFVLSGLWHGAGWTYVVWGGLHGLYLVCSQLTLGARKSFAAAFRPERFGRAYSLGRVLVTFHLVALAWVFFRANTLGDALHVLGSLGSGINFESLAMKGLGLPREEIVLAGLSIAFMEFIHVVQERGKMRKFLDEKHVAFRWSVYIALIVAIVLFGIFEKRDFIYFQF